MALILFLTKPDFRDSEVELDFLQRNFETVRVEYAKRGRMFPVPPELCMWSGDWIISYCYPLVVPVWLLEKPTKGAINFHPAPAEYPGAGSLNVALYDGAERFGVTCHYMEKEVDTGAIIDVRRFPVFETDSVWSLTQRAHNALLYMFFDIMDSILNGDELEPPGWKWTRKPYRLADFHALRRITPDMSEKRWPR